MANKIESPWDAYAIDVVNTYNGPLDWSHREYLIADIVKAMYHAYGLGHKAGAKSEREFPHREDMGR